MSDSVFQSFGALEMPVGIDDVADGYTSLDPARDRLLAMFAAAINSEFAATWARATGGTSLANTLPVNDTLPAEPDLQLMQVRKCSFPLLSLHRAGEGQIEPFLMDEDKLTQEWHLHYILGPLDIEGQRRVLDVGQAVAKLIASIIRDFGHQSYEDGANQIEAAGLMALRIKSYIPPGAARFEDDGKAITYWATRMTLESSEVSAPLTEQLSDFDGFDISVNVGGANEADISPDFVSGSTDPVYQYP